VTPRQLRRRNDEEADERAVVAPERQRRDDPVPTELDTRGDDGIAPGFRLAHEPTGERPDGRRVVTASVLDGPAEPVFVPGHETDPIMRPRPPDSVGQTRERAFTLVARAERTMQCSGDPLCTHLHECAQGQPHESDDPARNSEPVLRKSETCERDDHAAEREQLGSFLQLSWPSEVDHVRRRSTAELVELGG